MRGIYTNTSYCSS